MRKCDTPDEGRIRFVSAAQSDETPESGLLLAGLDLLPRNTEEANRHLLAGYISSACD
jgi:hypothetical protein